MAFCDGANVVEVNVYYAKGKNIFVIVGKQNVILGQPNVGETSDERQAMRKNQMNVANYVKEVVPFSGFYEIWRQNYPKEWEDHSIKTKSQLGKKDRRWLIFLFVLYSFICINHGKHSSGNAPVCKVVPHMHDSISIEPISEQHISKQVIREESSNTEQSGCTYMIALIELSCGEIVWVHLEGVRNEVHHKIVRFFKETTGALGGCWRWEEYLDG